MSVGTVVRWSDRGFGFIKPEEGGDDVFAHFSAIQDGNALREGDEVEYEVRFDDRRGKDRAENVTGGYYEDRRGGGGGGYGPGGDGRGGGGGRGGYDRDRGRDRDYDRRDRY